MLWESCSFSHTEHNKIGFAIFGLFYELILNLQDTGSIHKTVKNLFSPDPLKLLNSHRKALGISAGVLKRLKSSRVYPPTAGRARRRR
jgi:hypothetical protein